MKINAWSVLLQSAIVTVSGTFTTDKYTTLKDINHPNHKILLASPELSPIAAHTQTVSGSKPPTLSDVCTGATAGHTGYMVTGTKHFFFAFFESRSKPTADPLVLWTNGGPGCSSLVGLMQEHGPCRVNKEGTGTTKNEHSWINAANMIYFDQPLGVGFSFDLVEDEPKFVDPGSSFIAADDLVVFLKLWYQHFPQYKTHGFHLSGESFAGHYLPIFADAIVKSNLKARSSGQFKEIIPLKSIIMGNGLYDYAIQESTIFNMTCTKANGIGPVASKTKCDYMEGTIPKCRTLMAQCEQHRADDICNKAYDACSVFAQIYSYTGRSTYDVTRECHDAPCYALDDANEQYLNTPKVRQAFGITHVKRWEQCNMNVLSAFYRTNDPFVSTLPYIARLLQSGIHVLIYTGANDVICNYVGGEEALYAMSWTGQKEYQAASRSPVKWSGGLTWQSGNLRYARILGAGHFVPFDQPVAGLEIFQSWLEQRAPK